jgi:5-methylcytosine-specific restriction endonuclease McrA
LSENCDRDLSASNPEPSRPILVRTLGGDLVSIDEPVAIADAAAEFEVKLSSLLVEVRSGFLIAVKRKDVGLLVDRGEVRRMARRWRRMRLDRSKREQRKIVEPTERRGLSLRFAILERDAFACRYCGRKPPEVELEVDHLVPRSAGGTDDPSNLVTACFDCNRGKKDRQIRMVLVV